MKKLLGTMEMIGFLLVAITSTSTLTLLVCVMLGTVLSHGVHVLCAYMAAACAAGAFMVTISCAKNSVDHGDDVIVTDADTGEVVGEVVPDLTR